MDRRGFFKSMLGKGAAHGARRVDAVIIPFERAARAARDAIPGQDLPEEVYDTRPAERVEGEADPLPAEPVLTPVSEEDLMRVAADAGLIRHVEAAVALSRRTLRIVPGDGPPPPGSRSRLGGTPDLPAGTVWPRWDEQPMTFLAQLDLAEAHAIGVDPLLPTSGVLALFSSLDRTPSGTSPFDAGGTQVLRLPGSMRPQPAPDPAQPGQPASARALELSSELTLPAVWSRAVRALGLDEEEREAWELARRDLAELQGVEAWVPDMPLRSIHRLLGDADAERDDMALTLELAQRGIDVGFGPPAAHPEADRFLDVSRRWRLLLQLTVDESLGWRFGRGRDRLYVWAPADGLAAGELSQARALTR
ncbi:MAG TPA: DUF1963 domain-containing protein [Conexibacter sp.]